MEVPITIEAATLKHVGRPKLRFPTSEKTCADIFFNLVHLATSHGACGMSDSSCWWRLLETEDCRDREVRNAGERTLGECRGEGDNREENLRSKGWSGPGWWIRDMELWDTGTLLPGEDNIEPFNSQTNQPLILQTPT